MKRIAIAMWLCMICFTKGLVAQNPCATALKNAQTDYNEGKYYSALQKIENAETNLKCKDKKLAELKSKCQIEVGYSNKKNSANEKFEKGLYGDAKHLYQELLSSSSKQKSTKFLEERMEECNAKIAENGYIQIERVEFANLNRSSSVLNDYGAPIYSDEARLLKPRIVYKGCDEQSHSIRLSYKIIDPQGKMLSDPLFSPAGYTFAVNARVAAWGEGNQTINLEAWGSPDLSIYTAGDYVCEIWYNGRMIFSQSFTMLAQPLINRQFEVKSIPFNMVAVRGGSFVMGGDIAGKKCKFNARPAHSVRLTDFYISESEVTQELYHAVMRENPSMHLGDSLPVENVSWYEAILFCNRLSEMLGYIPCYVILENEIDKNNRNREDTLRYAVYINPRSNGFRLPTEAEWEYAAKGGDKARANQYSGTDDYTMWWNFRTSKGEPHPVATSRPNKLGIYDMCGSLSEWCYDMYGKYDANITDNPTGAVVGKYRVVRGGNWLSLPYRCRVNRRSFSSANAYGELIGLRIVKNK